MREQEAMRENQRGESSLEDSLDLLQKEVLTPAEQQMLLNKAKKGGGGSKDSPKAGGGGISPPVTVQINIKDTVSQSDDTSTKVVKKVNPNEGKPFGEIRPVLNAMQRKNILRDKKFSQGGAYIRKKHVSLSSLINYLAHPHRLQTFGAFDQATPKCSCLLYA